MEFSCVSVWIHCILPLHFKLVKRVWLHLLPSGISTLWCKSIPLAISSAQYKNSQMSQPLPTCQMLQSLNNSHGPFLDLSCPSCVGEPKTGHKIQTCLTRAKWKWKGHFPPLAGNALPRCTCKMQPRMSLAFAKKKKILAPAMVFLSFAWLT